MLSPALENNLINMAAYHLIRSYFTVIRTYLHHWRAYKKTYKNYFSIFFNQLKNNYPIKANLRTGEQLILDHWSLQAIGFGYREFFKIGGNILRITKKNLPPIKFTDWINGDLTGVFFCEDYKDLPVKDMIVIDIGANIGDSAIYFACKGAKKVIAIEPFPKNFESAKKNIELNQLQNKISIQLMGCANKVGNIIIDSEKSGSGCILNESKKGSKIPITTLEKILKTNNIDTAILKMDCEGCEYETILKASASLLRKFTHIQIEYHYGYLNLVKKLKESGFITSYDAPYFYSPANQHIGHIYAKLAL